MSAPSHSPRSGLAALAVGSGIFVSRIAGFIRDRFFAHYLGNSDAAGAFRAALRVPNLLQNLFGEGVLSASFIPVYARLRAEGKKEEAEELAAALFSILFLSMTLLCGIGVIASRPLIDILAPGFSGDVRELTVRLVQILFPGVGLLVLSAWCLGVLNSHRRFLLSYLAPVFWNLAIIVTLIIYGARLTDGRLAQMALAEQVAWGTVVGSLLQFLVQLPKALRLNEYKLFSLHAREKSLRVVLKNFLPALFARGVVQVSAFIDQILSSFLGPTTVSAMAYAQTLALLPISLFGMSVSTAELPELSSVIGTPEEVKGRLKERLERGLSRIAFFVLPSMILYLVLGDVVVGLLYQTGKFGAQDTRYVWWILAGYSVGLLASTQGRMCTSVFWGLQDTTTPAKYAFLRVVFNGALSYLVVFVLRDRLQLSTYLSAALMGASSGIAGWIEYTLIKRKLEPILGEITSFNLVTLKMLAASLVAGGVGYGLKYLLEWGPVLKGAIVIGGFGLIYLGITLALEIEEARTLRSALLRRIRR